MAAKILQIIPANDWYGKYTEDGATFFEPLACWALVENDNGSEMVGLVPVDKELIPCTDADGFAEYIHRVKFGE